MGRVGLVADDRSYQWDIERIVRDARSPRALCDSDETADVWRDMGITVVIAWVFAARASGAASAEVASPEERLAYQVVRLSLLQMLYCLHRGMPCCQ